MSATALTITSHIPWLKSQPMIVLSLIEMLIILVAVMLLSLAEMLIFRRYYARLKQSRRMWDDTLLIACHKPLQLMILVAGLSFCADIFASYFPNVDLITFTAFLRKALIIIAVVWAMVRYTRQLECAILDPDRPHKMEKSSAFALNRLFKIATVFFGGIAIMQLAGVPFSALVAFGGAGALAFSFAAKDILSNFLGGFTLYFEKPFSVGDWILVMDKSIEGTVDHIGWRSTRIINFDRRPIYVPNATFSTSAVTNCTRMTNRRMLTAITLRYQDMDKIPAIRDEIFNYVSQHEGIDHSSDPQVFFDTYGDFSVNLRVAAFTKSTNYLEFGLIQQEIFLKIGEIVYQHGADFAFPTQTLDVPDEFKIKMREAKA